MFKNCLMRANDLIVYLQSMNWRSSWVNTSSGSKQHIPWQCMVTEWCSSRPKKATENTDSDSRRQQTEKCTVVESNKTAENNAQQQQWTTTKRQRRQTATNQRNDRGKATDNNRNERYISNHTANSSTPVDYNASSPFSIPPAYMQPVNSSVYPARTNLSSRHQTKRCTQTCNIEDLPDQPLAMPSFWLQEISMCWAFIVASIYFFTVCAVSETIFVPNPIMHHGVGVWVWVWVWVCVYGEKRANFCPVFLILRNEA